jgi:NADPH:quinone reductase-like Zn-dependent oxidoreductase
VTTTMKAMTQHRYGSPDVLEFADVDRPDPAEGKVLVRVKAASVNPLDWHLMSGLPYIVRMQGGLRRPKQLVVGTDLAGTVEAVGPGVTAWKVGDEVFGVANGSCAEFAVSKETSLASKPGNVRFDEAAAVPVAAVTALQALRDKGAMQSGQRVLVNGAGGGVGTFAVQIAKAFGGHVTGVCSASKADMVRSIGADIVIDYASADCTTGDDRYDIVVDNVGNRRFSHIRRVMTPTGRYVVVGGPDKGRVAGPLTFLMKAKLAFLFSSQTAVPMLAKLNAADLRILGEMLADGRITPVIDRVYPLADTAAAFRHSQAGHAAGKVIISVAEA